MVPCVSAVSISVFVSPALSVSPSRSAPLTVSPTVLITTSAENTSSLIPEGHIFSIQTHCCRSEAGPPNKGAITGVLGDPVTIVPKESIKDAQ